jgi:hypothetical protein
MAQECVGHRLVPGVGLSIGSSIGSSRRGSSIFAAGPPRAASPCRTRRGARAPDGRRACSPPLAIAAPSASTFRAETKP